MFQQRWIHRSARVCTPEPIRMRVAALVWAGGRRTRTAAVAGMSSNVAEKLKRRRSCCASHRAKTETIVTVCGVDVRSDDTIREIKFPQCFRVWEDGSSTAASPQTENHLQTGSQRNERWKIRPLSNVGLFQKTRENKKRHQKVEISKMQSVVRKVEFYKKQDGKLKKSLKKERAATSSGTTFLTGSARDAASASDHASSCCTACRTQQEVHVNIKLSFYQ